MDLFEAIAARYSYRGLYSDSPVPRADLAKIMEAGLAAPSGCNTQTTGLIGLDDPALIERVAGHMNKPHFASAPAAICVLARHVPGYADVYFDVQDYSAAIQNMLLAITAMGYVSCWVEGYITGDAEINRKMSAELAVPEGYRLVAYLPVGIPAQDGGRAKKKPFEERAWFNRDRD